MPKTKSQPTNTPEPRPYDMSSVSESLLTEHAQIEALFQAQRSITQRFIEGQAQALADALLNRASQVRFKLPDEVCLDPSGAPTASIPSQSREQTAGGLLDGLTHPDLRSALRHRLLELEGSNEQGVVASARLIRHAAASHLVHNVLPSGRAVTYAVADGEEVPTIPVAGADEVESAITAETDAIVENGPRDGKRGELLVPYVPSARRFYLPQWVAFDDEGNLLAGSVAEAEASIGSMRQFLEALHAAIAIAPHIVADEEYQRKRYGMLGQLINQGRALAHYQMGQIIETISRRGGTGQLNRGLSLSIPYFDDQELEIRLRGLQVTPAGRVMFVPAFVTRAAREEQAKVAQDTRLNASTRKYLLLDLELLAQAFETTPDR